jgi:hypothetical protein
MKKNTGSADRILRIVIGLGLLSITVIGPKTLWGLIGIIPIITASFSFCPLYTVIGMSTCPLGEK